jgi:4-amino-4-deoxy-L-arabinose transferase-like glycosyltransferase
VLSRPLIQSGLAAVLAVALGRLAVHVALGGEYGWHRDELAVLDDARHLAWGYVAYPPVAPAIARVGVEIFGPSLTGVRFFSALAQALVVVLAGLMAFELGGGRRAQIVAAVAVAIAPISVIQGVLFQYVSFDFLWWVLLSWLVIRLLRSDDSRWWLAIGATIGAGMMTKYTIIFLVAGLVAGFFVSGPRRHLRSVWLWAGALLSIVIVLPNLLWQWRHDFITREFLLAINARDVAIGRTDDYVLGQLLVGASIVTVPLWIAGLSFYFLMPEGKRFRMIGWMFVVPFFLFLLAGGRSYYLAPAYPMLLAAGAVVWDRWLPMLGRSGRRLATTVMVILLAGGAIFSAVVMLPVHPVKSPLWDFTAGIHDNFAEQIGWEDLTATVAGIYARLPEEEKRVTTILTGNYGQAGAINLYGPRHGLPSAISGVNSYWLRGWGEVPPQSAIVLGYSAEGAERLFERCDEVGKVTNRYGVENEESTHRPAILLCRSPRFNWSDAWPHLRRFG